MRRPVLILTVDTEGDNIWACPESVTTENARYMPRFQNLCEDYGYKPTYLVNYEMAIDPFFSANGPVSGKKDRGRNRPSRSLVEFSAPYPVGL